MTKRTFRHYGTIVNGKKVYSNPDLQQISISELEGQEFEEVIQKRKKEASKNQYGYLFGGIFADALEYETFDGWTVKELEQFFVEMFLSHRITKDILNEDGSKTSVNFLIKGSLSGIDKESMQKFIDKVIRFLAEQGIVIKNPEEYYYGKYQSVS